MKYKSSINTQLNASAYSNNYSRLLAILVIAITMITCTIISGIMPIQTCLAEEAKYYLVKDNTIANVVSDDVEGNIIIPKSYYVRHTGDEMIKLTDGTVLRVVEYNGINCTVDMSYLSKNTTTTVTNPYYKHDMILSLLPDNDKTFLYNYLVGDDQNRSKLGVDIKIEFLANSTLSEEFVYVKTCEPTPRYGYVETPLYTNTIIISPNLDAIDPDSAPVIGLPDTSPDVQPEVTPDTSNMVRIVLITLLCMLAVLVIFLIYKPTSKKKPSRDDFYEV